MLALSTLFRIFFVHKEQIDYHTLGVITDMTIGGLGAYLSINSKAFKKMIEDLPGAVIGCLYLLTIAYIIFKQEIFASTFMLVIKRIVMASTFIFIILEQNFARKSLFKMGNWKIISTLGKYTYGLYCLHGIVILLNVTLLRKFSLNTSSWQIWLLELPLSFIGSIAISWFSFRYFESWFLKLKTKFAYIIKE
jgi:peptidoglycan/LPS O-acetylase OafA/YrhL